MGKRLKSTFVCVWPEQPVFPSSTQYSRHFRQLIRPCKLALSHLGPNCAVQVRNKWRGRGGGGKREGKDLFTQKHIPSPPGVGETSSEITTDQAWNQWTQFKGKYLNEVKFKVWFEKDLFFMIHGKRLFSLQYKPTYNHLGFCVQMLV